MKTQLPITTVEQRDDQEHRVLQFRLRAVSPPRHRATDPRPSPDPIPSQGASPGEANDLSIYEQDPSGADDFRHRMLANTAALAITVVLIAAGIWLAVSLAQMRNMQDCVLMGRRDCARISSQPSPPG
jgi:hypothetical protein